ncbi:D-alanyl-D-alanine carboxypeptidase family protein [Alkalithermobacter paradoxus]|uniref:serine-type D-Ala-D-Ala carboxypeptidase n=1 Tax=Alkalithermobacter paradoxus TaxID=29349 RepID=A0A1V4IAW7_9FIRM|nr:D-alanyl-D-alanine carboxypeptidase DacF precursor [[Clostridium] thermoalcaliphilum]
MKKRFGAIFVLLVLLFNLTSFDIYSNQNIDRYIKAGILMDEDSGRIVYEYNIHDQVAIASLTKMMTFLVALEAIRNNEVSKHDTVTISQNAARLRGSTYNLRTGEEVELIELLKALMIVSGNDAAVAIAEHIAGTESNFVQLMNNKAREIGMYKTVFFNSHGLPIYKMDDRIENLSSAKDLSILVKYLLDNYREETLSVTSIKTYSNPKRNFERSNTNPLMSIFPEVDGIKTGYTGLAGYCLAFTLNVKSEDKNDRDFRLIGLVLGSGNQKERLAGSKNLLEYGRDNFIKTKILSKHEYISTRYLFGSNELPVDLISEEEIWVFKGKDENLNTEIKLNDLSFPVRKNDVIGTLTFTSENGEILGSVNLISNTEIKWIPIKIQLELLKKSFLRLFAR